MYVEPGAMPDFTPYRRVVIAIAACFCPSISVVGIECGVGNIPWCDIYGVCAAGSIHEVLLEAVAADGIDLEFSYIVSGLVCGTLSTIREIAFVPRSQIAGIRIIAILDCPASIRIVEVSPCPIIDTIVNVIGVVFPCGIPFRLHG